MLTNARTDGGGKADLRHSAVCFVPSVSGVAVPDIGNQDDLYVKIDSLDPDSASAVHT
ncbi:hypothetical protein M878_21655 [Streptomyces roseochromogenus subsp. oscitans DS 12.976]|uniref:Uncharacterized protein n=1 Tax=Streptomyces roseochromogenus subsp. oscitans DS 12.976 TaxID=1352936 RepID=V6KC30_STRRC|nr:hypothetical protein M878_21655 [Streptomyces roseochromogenus subsp. oscitans DS 12.976]